MEKENEAQKKKDEMICPDCNAILRHEGGCVYCFECGWSVCK